jgi:hypothetical protein
MAPKQFPTKWLTYNQRINADLDETFANGDPEAFFDQDYMNRLVSPIKQQEEWMLKLFALQFTILVFLVVGFAAKDVTFNFFGVALGNVPGIKEMLLALSATIALLILVLAASRDTTIVLAQSISDRTVDSKFAAYAKFASPSAFSFRLYLPREHGRWMFATKVTKSVTILIALLTSLIAIASIVASVSIQVVLIGEVWRHPTIGNWSYFSLAYVGAAYLLNILILLRRSLPFPYEDKSSLKKQARLR